MKKEGSLEATCTSRVSSKHGNGLQSAEEVKGCLGEVVIDIYHEDFL